MKKSDLTKSKSRPWESLIHFLLFSCGVISIFITMGIIGVLLFESISFFSEVSFAQFFLDTQWTPLFLNKHFGIWPLVAGTFLVSCIALLVAGPIGLLIAVLLSEFTSERLRRTIKPMIEILAGIPTVVYGYFALLFVTPLFKTFIPELSGINALSPGIVMGIMIIPMISSLSEDALYAVPRSLRDGAFALGSSRLQVALKVVFPAAFSGISSAFTLAISRAIGETMIVTIAAGQQPNLTLNPLESIETMTAYIVQVSLGDTPHGTIEYKTIFVVGMLLFLFTFILNTFSHWSNSKFREIYE